MNKDAIRNTVVCTYDEEDGYILQSPLCSEIMAIGDTEEEAKDLFEDMLEQHYIAYKAGRLAKPVIGRPSKSKIRLAAEVAAETKQNLALLASEKGISQGEAVEFLYGFYKRKA